MGCETLENEVTQSLPTEFRSEDSGGPSDEGPGEGDSVESEGCGTEFSPELSIVWLDDDAILPSETPAEIRLISEVEYPLEVVVRQRWDGGVQQQNTASLGSFSLGPGDTLDLEVGTDAFENAGSEYSGMLKISVDLFDEEARQIATFHSPARFFHRAGDTIAFYDEQTLWQEHSGGLLVGELPAGALLDEFENPVALTRVRHGGAGVVGERRELGNPVEDAP